MLADVVKYWTVRMQLDGTMDRIWSRAYADRATNDCNVGTSSSDDEEASSQSSQFTLAMFSGAFSFYALCVAFIVAYQGFKSYLNNRTVIKNFGRRLSGTLARAIVPSHGSPSEDREDQSQAPGPEQGSQGA